MQDLTLAIIIFLIILTVVIVLRVRLGERFEIRNSDILVALIPLALWLVLTGRIQKLEFADFKIEAAFAEASRAAITGQVAPVNLPVEPVRMNPKQGVERIPSLLQSRTQALSFELGYSGYYGPAIETYLAELVRSPDFRYLVITGRDGKFVGLASAREINDLFRIPQTPFSSEKFARWLSSGDVAALNSLPAYIPAKNAIKRDADKATTLEQMETLHLDMLPVVDDQGRFSGIVERSRLTSSLIIDVARKVQK